MRADQTFSTLTRFVENACNIYISKQVYYKVSINVVLLEFHEH
jgi:hypothetical protein